MPPNAVKARYGKEKLCLKWKKPLLLAKLWTSFFYRVNKESSDSEKNLSSTLLQVYKGSSDSDNSIVQYLEKLISCCPICNSMQIDTSTTTVSSVVKAVQSIEFVHYIWLIIFVSGRQPHRGCLDMLSREYFVMLTQTYKAEKHFVAHDFTIVK
uniref:Uncharacterized protein n=1 Tax=Glossina brevipalpis TaxID=37001 RepID=A0A1A9W7W1_9MUSC